MSEKLLEAKAKGGAAHAFAYFFFFFPQELHNVLMERIKKTFHIALIVGREK